MGFLSWIFRAAAVSDAPRRAPGSATAPTPSVVGGAGYPRSVAGESYRQDHLRGLCGGHNRHGHELECDAYLVPEPSNPHDANAVQVMIEGGQVGFLSRDDAARYVVAARSAGLEGARVRVKAKIVGGWRTNQHDSGHFGVKLAMPWPVKFVTAEDDSSR